MSIAGSRKSDGNRTDIFFFRGQGIPGLTSSLRYLHHSLACLVGSRSELQHIPITGRTEVRIRYAFGLSGDVLDKGAPSIRVLRKFIVDAGPALDRSLVIVTSEVQGGDGFHERVELLFTFASYDRSRRIVFLWHWIPRSI